MSCEKIFLYYHCLNCSCGETYVLIKRHNGKIELVDDYLYCDNCKAKEYLFNRFEKDGVFEDIEDALKERKKNLELEIEYSYEDKNLIIMSAIISKDDLAIKCVAFFEYWDSCTFGKMKNKIIKITEQEKNELCQILENEDELKKYLINNYDL